MPQINDSKIYWHIIVSYLIFIGQVIILGSSMGRLESFVLGCWSAFVACAYLCFQFRFLFDVKIAVLSIFGFVLKLLIGYAFWELYMWPNYFASQFSQMQFAHYEYLFTPRGMHNIAQYRLENGFFSVPLTELAIQTKYFFINYIMSNLFMSGSSNYFDLSIQNSLFSFYSAVVVSLIGIRLGCSRRDAKVIFLLAFYQPLSINSSMIWRDVVGQFFAFSGVYFFLLSSFAGPVKANLGVIFSALSMAVLRTVYVFIPIILYATRYVHETQLSGSIARNFSLLVTFIIGFYSIFATQIGAFIQDGYSSYLNDALNLKFFALLPIDFGRAIVGPFPWLVWFTFTDNTIFLVSQYLQAVYVVVIIYYTILNYRRCPYGFKFYLVLLVMLLLTMSVTGSEVQSSYFSFAVALLLPVSAAYLTVFRFFASYIVVFYGFIALNAMYIFGGFYGSGFGEFL